MSTSIARIVEPIEHPDEGTWTQLATAAQIEEQPRQNDDAPFPIAVKANIAVRGFRRSAACPVFDTVPEEVDAPVVALLRRAGAVVVGTTNMHELAFGITSDNAAFGAARIPSHPGFSAGGSSGGSAAAVASGAVPIALGTDTGGSVSIPAAHCGIAGFRPSTGRWPTSEILGLSTTRDTPGVFARSVNDLERVDRWVADERPARAATGAADATGAARTAGAAGRPIRIGLPTRLCDDLRPETRAAFEAALDRLPARFKTVHADFDEIQEAAMAAETPLVMWESRRLLGDAAGRALGLPPEAAFERLVREVASPDVRSVLLAELRSPVTAEAYTEARSRVFAARSAYSRLMSSQQLDALLFPTAPAPAPALGMGGIVEHLGRELHIFNLYTRNTAQGTVLGVPMVTVPAPVARGALPVGVTLQGHRFDDRSALALARELETALAPEG
ncbi:amidase family protein [Leucobacter tenebrionis]|uniref:amidase family protein n=1 Tax=Leucobacter tenebrionis TaxID=2873270 RepID=UPI001CA68A24|nr:amidase family protein [Leucobacter tenebrionis]QZY52695.1 hypothetical protein KVY00_04385 [Leucobacter tenebrionis]